METKMNKKVWFVTGASTGFGKELVNVIANNGDIAIGTFRKKEQAESFTDIESLKFGVVLDVTDYKQVKSGIETAIQHFGRIDVLVNNAGYGSLGSLEEVSEGEVRRQFDINVFGPISMIKNVLPHMRKRREGHIINITSVGGVIGFTSSGIYNGSKFALEGIGHSLAKQVSHLGIKVTNVEPGPFRTNWAGNSATYKETEIQDYQESVGRDMEWVKSIDGRQAGDPAKGAKAIYELVDLKNPPLLLPLGEYAYEAISGHYNQSLKDLSTYEPIGRPTDYPVDQTE
ncbi:oxidoreductase [Ulvibacterium sp.]|uniref:oxidoreductase n=1 Tax=Ulvibacterium sp. TaxID=2665914 RepID=UPI00263097FA|nr:oxidoreductase [Ulvibacterium sp.]